MEDERKWRAPVMGDDGEVQPEAPPPLTITGVMADYAKRSAPAASSLGIFMDDQQMRDAGVHPEQLEAAGADDSKSDPGGGYAKVIGTTRSAVTKGHTAASWLGQGPTVAKGLKEAASILRQAPNWAGWKAARQTVEGAAAEAASHPVIAGINTLTRASIPPLYAAESLARGANQARNGPLDLEALMGNAIRGTVVTGTSIVSPALAGVANQLLPDGKTMGHVYGKSLVDTDGRALLLP